MKEPCPIHLPHPKIRKQHLIHQKHHFEKLEVRIIPTKPPTSTTPVFSKHLKHLKHLKHPKHQKHLKHPKHPKHQAQASEMPYHAKHHASE